MSLRHFTLASEPRPWLSYGARFLLAMLCASSGERGLSYAADRVQLAKKLGLPPGNLANFISELEGSGLLCVEGDQYRVLIDDDEQAPEVIVATGVYRKKAIPKRLRLQVFERDGWMCLACGHGEWLCADHVVPESKGGPMTFENLQTLCHFCNCEKGVKTIDYRKASQ